ncbi:MULTISPECIES: hypothetical protein [Aneurinibacillus]|uniref:Uncharacterized protein n=1 Tax=Aneurinibacillus thermoaerophilus TaxID=143495 RepID=A0A1G7X5Z4_ANETH|nr:MULTISPECIES: hypothetical protein [Aneurinibacillus]AMA73215.1 hypothetical protein ACH33_10320 [Aneurinibacillus sp. XH2]MED0674361.1 hypothetical protein [Aneurinibacillus thermoaerophilus]MED0678380.1 hypothetical protein [Aneurinibacillus thermoaerophilus]MED0736096.1 hypothetical protein [Aneurinibacillus thermoaerophilus]MED0756940.1 hypothetical protein [Aneurinibacillus thermoaerophilus]
MIEVKLQPACSHIMYFGAVKGGRFSFSLQDDALIGRLSSSEFAAFLKDNNLVTYHDALKSYESGEIVGRFETLT